MPTDIQPLLEYIDGMKAQGASDEFIVALLRQNGWSEKRIYQAFGSWYEARIGRAIPNGGGRIEAAKDAFLYLLAFIALGIWTIQLGALLFTAIDRTFLEYPNPALEYTNSTWIARQMANALASIIVAFPLFLLVTQQIVRGVKRQPERLESSVRKWLTYIALVITASIVIGDVVTFLAYLLRGDLDTRFVLKVLTVLVIAGGVFAYYLDSLHRERMSSTRNRLFGASALAAVMFGVVVGFIQIGSPAVQRSVSEDARRLSDLSTIAAALHTNWLAGRDAQPNLPATLQDLQRTAVGTGVGVADPASGRTYIYTPLRGSVYRLCATFAHPSPPETPAQWRHPAGNTCFTLDANRDIERVQRAW